MITLLDFIDRWCELEMEDQSIITDLLDHLSNNSDVEERQAAILAIEEIITPVTGRLITLVDKDKDDPESGKIIFFRD